MSTFAEDYRRLTAQHYDDKLLDVALRLRELADKVERVGRPRDVNCDAVGVPAYSSAVAAVLSEVQNGHVFTELASLAKQAALADEAWASLLREQDGKDS